MCLGGKETLITVDRDDPVYGEREWRVSDNGLLTPLHSAFHYDAWYPRNGPIFQSDEAPVLSGRGVFGRNLKGLMAYGVDDRNSILYTPKVCDHCGSEYDEESPHALYLIPDIGEVAGVVALHGTVVEHKEGWHYTGYRASHAEIIMLGTGDERIYEQLVINYGDFVPIIELVAP